MIERELAALAVAWPDTPDLATPVARRIAQPAPSRRERRRAFAVALLAIVTATALIPPARAAVLRLLGIEGGVKVFRVPELPPVPEGRLTLGVRVPLATADALAGFPIERPRVLGAPTEVRFATAIAGGAVTLYYGDDHALTESAGGAIDYAEKLLGAGTRLRRVTVNGAPAIWLTGEAHVIIMRDEDGNVLEAVRTLPGANVLLWDDRALAHRLETRAPLRTALRIARSTR